MRITFLIPVATALLLAMLPAPLTDAMWAEMSRTVAAGDFEGYAALYHPDAVLVNGLNDTSYPISAALDGWKPGFDATKAGHMKASVEFRFTRRIVSETTAFETGIFNYSSQTGQDAPESAYIHLDALSVLVDGEWKMVMEFQKSVATEEEWAAAITP